MAELVLLEAFGLRYDTAEEKWRSYDAARGIWRCRSLEAATSLLIDFMAPFLNRIRDHADYMTGATMTAATAPETPMASSRTKM
jgi:hypothetical protein